MAARVAAGVALEFAGLSRLQAAVGQGFGVVVGQETGSSAERTTALLNGDPTRYRFTPQEDAFLEELEQACFQFFWDEVNPSTGLVKDRSQAAGPDSRNVASIAATGFGLTALCIADHRGWQEPRAIRERVTTTLRFVESRVPQAHGFFCHFLNIQNGERVLQSEVSSIDTAIFICGVLTCAAYFDDIEIRTLANRIYQRIDWNWLLHGDKTLSMGWTLEHGFIRSRWDSYSELMMVYLLGLGSSATAMSKQSWDAWTRPYFEFNGVRYIGSHAPLFVHSIRTPGSIFAANVTSTRTISRIPWSQPRCTNCGAWNYPGNFRITLRTCGALPHPIRHGAMPFGAALQRWDASTEASCRARRGARWRFCRKKPCGC